MVLSESMRNYFVGHITFPLTNYLYNRRGILSRFYSLIKTEHLPEEEMRTIQLNKLKKVIAHAYQQVPFYRDRFKSIGLDPRDIKDLDDLKLIPLLSRKDVIDYHKQMVADEFGKSIDFAEKSENDPGTPIPYAVFSKHKLVRNTSSGSTGAPTVFYEDGTRSAINWAHELRLKYWFGLKPGAREARVTRISTDYMPNSRLIRSRKLLWNQLLLPGVNLGDQDYQHSLEKIMEFKPDVIWGFTSACSGLAEYIIRNGGLKKEYQPKVAVGWAAPVYEHEEKIMREGLRCEVTNIYGAREVGHIAGRCPSGQFHINAENMIVEEISLDDMQNGKHGEIVVTDIDKLPMPFIRYRMGDVGTISKSDCECGRKLPIIKELIGRTGEIFFAKSGKMISPNFWCRTFMNKKISGSVRRFQVIYKMNKDLRIKIERDNNFSVETTDYIQNMVSKNFGQDTDLEFVYVNKISPEISGKYLMVKKEEVNSNSE